MKTRFTKEESMLMMLYNPGSREGLIRELAGTRSLVRLRFPNLAFMSWITWDGVCCYLPCFWCCLTVSF